MAWIWVFIGLAVSGRLLEGGGDIAIDIGPVSGVEICWCRWTVTAPSTHSKQLCMTEIHTNRYTHQGMPDAAGGGCGGPRACSAGGAGLPLASGLWLGYAEGFPLLVLVVLLLTTMPLITASPALLPLQLSFPHDG
mmetsp:Transcript_78514/g.230282  ORF Transcript_78514/g.230282 Transcript_78514/m.230282 type:complete len:136 (-) Transcript_78514:1701-2108(-)